MITIRDNGDGWKCYAEWYGAERVVFEPKRWTPFEQLRECIAFRKGRE